MRGILSLTPCTANRADGLLGLHCRDAGEGSINNSGVKVTRAPCSHKEHAHDETHHSGKKERRTKCTKVHEQKRNHRHCRMDCRHETESTIHHCHLLCTSHKDKHHVKQKRLGRCVLTKKKKKKAPGITSQEEYRTPHAQSLQEKRRRRQLRQTTPKNEKSIRRQGNGTSVVTTTPTHTNQNSALAGAFQPFAL